MTWNGNYKILTMKFPGPGAGLQWRARWPSLLNAFGIRASSDCQFCVLDDGTYTMVYEHPRYREFLEAVQGLFEEGLIDPEFATRTQAELFTAMDSNLVGTTMTWAERARISTTTNREAGDEDALWTCVAPIVGPHGDQMTQERAAVSSVWCISADAAAAGKVEDILRLFNWCYSDEGKMLYNYGIEGVSYDMVDGTAVLKPVMVANGFVDYRSLGCEFEPFGGEWETNAFMQCLFAGMTLEELDDASASFYNGLAVVNNDYFYAMPQTLDTEAYVEYRAELITTGVCVLRDQTIAGQMTVDDFFTQYESLKAQGLQEVIDAGTGGLRAGVALRRSNAIKKAGMPPAYPNVYTFRWGLPHLAWQPPLPPWLKVRREIHGKHHIELPFRGAGADGTLAGAGALGGRPSRTHAGAVPASRAVWQ